MNFDTDPCPAAARGALETASSRSASCVCPPSRVGEGLSQGDSRRGDLFAGPHNAVVSGDADWAGTEIVARQSLAMQDGAGRASWPDRRRGSEGYEATAGGLTRSSRNSWRPDRARSGRAKASSTSRCSSVMLIGSAGAVLSTARRASTSWATRPRSAHGCSPAHGDCRSQAVLSRRSDWSEGYPPDGRLLPDLASRVSKQPEQAAGAARVPVVWP